MGSKKIKKLELKKEMISNLSDFEQSKIVGGGITSESAAYGECDCYYPTQQVQCHTGYSPCEFEPTLLCCYETSCGGGYD